MSSKVWWKETALYQCNVRANIFTDYCIQSVSPWYAMNQGYLCPAIRYTRDLLEKIIVTEFVLFCTAS